MAMEDTNVKMCRPCGLRKVVTPAECVLTTETFKNWYLCRKHADVVARSMVGLVYEFRMLREDERKATNGE